jgi:hypothetical protein
MTDTQNRQLPELGQDAGEWFGSDYAGLYVVAVGPPIRPSKKAKVVLATESRPDRMTELKAYFARDSARDRLDASSAPVGRR